jgi:hypothetical protein
MKVGAELLAIVLLILGIAACADSRVVPRSLRHLPAAGAPAEAPLATAAPLTAVEAVPDTVDGPHPRGDRSAVLATPRDRQRRREIDRGHPHRGP